MEAARLDRIDDLEGSCVNGERRFSAQNAQAIVIAGDSYNNPSIERADRIVLKNEMNIDDVERKIDHFFCAGKETLVRRSLLCNAGGE